MPVNSFENYPMAWKPQRSELERPYYRSLAACLERDIRSGLLAENTQLPPQRELADFLDLNLSTVMRAYKLCMLKGLLYAVTGRGTFVAPGISAQDTFLAQSRPVIEMGMIRPFYACNQSILHAAAQVMNRPGSARLLEYSDPLGTARQRAAAQMWLHGLGVDVGRENLLLAAGAQNALSIVLIALFGAGDKIAVDEYTYTNFKGLANFLHIQLVAVETDAFGMRPDALLQACKQTGVRGLYLMPTCANPTGIFLPEQRRRQLAGLARRFGLLVIEDDIYSFLAPQGTPSLFALLPEQTVHICSLSKSLCAGLRVAFLAFPPQYREALVAGLLNINLKTVSLNAEIAAGLIESGAAGQIVQQKIALAQGRNRVVRSVFAEGPQDEIARFFYWLPLPAGQTSEEMELRALQKGVHVLGSHRFAVQGGQSRAYLRVAIASPDTEEELKRGLVLLKSCLEDGAEQVLV